jgi:uncharacterized protein (DUF305 family)
MPRVYLGLIAASLYLFAFSANGQQAPAKTDAPSVVQPGAPGKSSKVLDPNQAPVGQGEPTKPDVDFMQGMIMHHGQAVAMTKLLQTRTRDPQLKELGNRIDISQTDELKWMKGWLTDHGKPISAMEDMPGMDMSSMMPAMPGMLSPAQMDALKKAKEPEFDHLFLTGMIQHHTGALKMVKDLFETPGAAQDPWLFEFTSDVVNTQQAEIDIMHQMLAKEKH